MYIIRQIKYYQDIISDVISHNKNNNICKKKLNKTSTQTQFLRVKELRFFWMERARIWPFLPLSFFYSARRSSGSAAVASLALAQARSVPALPCPPLLFLAPAATASATSASLGAFGLSGCQARPGRPILLAAWRAVRTAR